MRLSILILFLFSITSLGSFAQEKYKITADKLNVRSTNDPKSKIIAYVPQNEIVEVIDNKDPKFIKIKLRKKEGWISREFVTLVQKNPVEQAKATSPETLKVDSIKPSPSTDSLAQSSNSSSIFNSSMYASYMHSSHWVFIISIHIVAFSLFFLIYEYVNSNLYKTFAFIALIIFSYTIYQGFIKRKNVLGKYHSLVNNQFSTFEFKPSGEVLIYDQLMDSTYRTTYQVEGSMVYFKQDENLFIMIIKDDTTLLGDGFLKGQYVK